MKQWNVFKCGWTELVIYETADAFVASGLASAGYTYVNLDGCELAPCPDQKNETACHTFTRDAGGVLHDVDMQRLPNGAKAACDYIHSKGLKCGGYSDAAYTTCQGRPGSLFYERQDTQMWADIGVDLWKVDNCGEVPPGWEKPEVRYPPLRDALNATGRPILFSLCVWGVDEPWLWGPEVGNTWRMYDDSDICDHTPGFGNGCWQHVMKIADAAVGLGRYAGPGGWNDLDILGVSNFGMTAAEDAAHFFVWVIAKSPLLLGNDVRAMSPETLALLTSPAVLAVSGDALGVGGDLVNRTCSPEAGVEVPCSGSSSALPRSDYPLVYATPCAAPTDPRMPSQVFSIAPAPYVNASAGAATITSAQSGLCLALWDCSAPVVVFDCTPDPASCSGVRMTQFEWLPAPLGAATSNASSTILQLRALGGAAPPGQQCLAVGAPGGQLALTPCTPSGQGWVHNAQGQLVNTASGLCADVAPPPTSAPVDTWAVPLAGGARAALLVNRRAVPVNMTLNFSALGVPQGQPAALECLFPLLPLGQAEGSFTAEVEPHGSLFLRLTPVGGGGNGSAWRPSPPAAALLWAQELRSSFYSSAPALREERQRRRRQGL